MKSGKGKDKKVTCVKKKRKGKVADLSFEGGILYALGRGKKIGDRRGLMKGKKKWGRPAKEWGKEILGSKT